MSPGAYKGLLHTHETLVGLYILLFLIKLILLLAKSPKLGSFRRKTRMLEMILPTLFLITGIALAYNSAGFLQQPWFITKIVLIIIVVVTGILTFRRNSAVLGILTMLIFVYIMLLSYRKNLTLHKGEAMVPAPQGNTSSAPAANDAATKGSMVYNERCITCHGPQGDMGQMGATNLQTSSLSEDGVKAVVTHGRNVMPAFEHMISEEDINNVTKYVMTMRK